MKQWHDWNSEVSRRLQPKIGYETSPLVQTLRSKLGRLVPWCLATELGDWYWWGPCGSLDQTAGYWRFVEEVINNWSFKPPNQQAPIIQVYRYRKSEYVFIKLILIQFLAQNLRWTAFAKLDPFSSILVMIVDMMGWTWGFKSCKGAYSPCQACLKGLRCI